MLYDIIVLSDESRRSKRIREELTRRGYIYKEVASVQDWRADIESAYRKSSTEIFWLVDSHYHIFESFKFDYVIPEWDKDYIHIFAADGTEEAKEKHAGFGAVRLYPKSAFVNGKIPGYNHDFYGGKGIKHLDIKCGCYLSSKNLNIYFLVKDELNSDENFAQLLKFQPTATPVQSIGSIFESHKHVSDASYTQLFSVVDADCYINRNYLKIDENINYSYVNVWQVRNPINGLVYGHGGPKLLSRHLFKKSIAQLDMTFSLTTPDYVRVLPEVVGEHRFNWSAFSSWRTAFREVVKLTLAKENADNLYRRDIWCSAADKKQPFWEQCLKGAKAGYAFAKENSNRSHMINHYPFLESEMRKTK